MGTGSAGVPGPPGSKARAPSIVCPVCGTENPATRQFCRKCAADLRAPVLPGGAPVPPPPEPVPLRPILVGGGIAAALLALLVIVLLVLGGGDATPSPSPSAAPTASPAATLAPTTAPTAPPPTEPPTSAPPSASAGPAAPRIRSFRAPESVNCSSPDFTGTIHVTWRVENAIGVSISIDGPGIYERYTQLEGSADVPFACGGITHSYLLTTIGGTGPDAVRQLFVESVG